MFELDLIKEQIAQLQAQINCIKNGDCCDGGGTDTSIYINDGTFGTNRQGTLTDTLTILSSGVVPLNTFYDSGNVSLSQNPEGNLGVGTTTQSAKLHVVGRNSNNGFLPDDILLRADDNTGQYRLRLHNGGKAYFSAELTSGPDFGMFFATNGDAWTTLNVSTNTTTTSNTAYGASIGVQGNTSTAETFAGIYANTVPGASLRNLGGILESLSSSINMGLYDDGVKIYTGGLRASGSPLATGTMNFVFGGNFSAGSLADISTVINGYVAGIHAEGVLRQTGEGGNVILVGGVFRTRDVTPAPNQSLRHIAILVPATDNLGIVVINADDISGNDRAQLEVTGNIELFGAGNGVIVQDSVDGNKYLMQTVGGTVTATLV